MFNTILLVILATRLTPLIDITAGLFFYLFHLFSTIYNHGVITEVTLFNVRIYFPDL